jgi:hypothetical protein
MPPHPERHWPRIAIGYTVLVALLAGITAFAYEAAPPPYQSVVVRLAVAFLLVVLLLHIRSYFRGDPLWDPPSEFESALVPERASPKFDASLVKVRAELADSVKSRAYFEKVLWPHLQTIAATHRIEIEPPPRGRLGWRGPSLRLLAALLTRLEGHE